MVASRQQRGFTLIEVLVAFMILAISLSVIFRIFSGGMRNVGLSEDYARAVLVAEAQLTGAGVSEPLLDGVTAGEWDARFRWERVIEPYRPWEQDKALAAPLLAYRVTVSVDWDHAGQMRQITLSSVRLKLPLNAGVPG
jgi:general secretion pathway protein I